MFSGSVGRLATLSDSAQLAQGGAMRNHGGDDGDDPHERTESFAHGTRDDASTTRALAAQLAGAPGPQCSSFHRASTDTYTPRPSSHVCPRVWLCSPRSRLTANRRGFSLLHHR